MILNIEKVTILLPSCCEEKEAVRYLAKYKRYWWLPWKYIKDDYNIPQLFDSISSIGNHLENMGFIFKGYSVIYTKDKQQKTK